MARVLIVYHSQTGNTKALAEAVGAGAASVKGTEVKMKRALEAGLEDLIDSDAVAFGTPDYFSYMAGALKDFFDRTYYPSQGKVEGKPYVAFVSHGGGGAAIKSVERFCSRFKLKKAAGPLLAEGRPTKVILTRAKDLGKILAEAAK